MGISKAATEKEVKASYRKLARKYHPDLNPDNKTAELKFKEINEANEVLSNSDNRKKTINMESIGNIVTNLKKHKKSSNHNDSQINKIFQIKNIQIFSNLCLEEEPTLDKVNVQNLKDKILMQNYI